MKVLLLYIFIKSATELNNQHVVGELFLALVTSKRAHAKILKVDPSAALDVPGVVGFIDHTDIKGSNRWGSLFPEEELFATKEVCLVSCHVLAERSFLYKLKKTCRKHGLCHQKTRLFW